MEKKQTSVEWFIEKRNRLEYEYSTKSIGISEYIERKKDIEVQAKQMEKEQIKNSYLDGDSNGCGCYDWSTEEQAEDYYNETYLGIIKEEE